MIKKFQKNQTGRDLIVGDIHGNFSKLQRALDVVGFDPDAGDRLFSVGDLVDRGPESASVLDWLAKPWFHPVQGNHEDMAIRWGRPGCAMDAELYAQNGGAWNIANTPPERLAISDALGVLPLAIEVETAAGPVGIVHADCPFKSWQEFTGLLARPDLTRAQHKAIREIVMWSRSRIESEDRSGVAGVAAVVVGHTPVDEPRWLGNVLYIDTAAWYRTVRDDREFVIFDLATLQPATRRAEKAEGAAC